jgi:glycosyltransferase involved in cell wall biosynthesis
MIVSVLMPTYKHERTISRAIESFLAQSVTSEDNLSELIISDDCSPDSTSEIGKKYALKYPDKIRYYRQEKNLGLIGNYGFLMSKANAKYIAILESDDYWTNPYKLQMQIAIMEKRPTCGVVYTHCTFLRENFEENLLAVECSAAGNSDNAVSPVAEKSKVKGCISLIRCVEDNIVGREEMPPFEENITILRRPQMFRQLVKSNLIPAVTVLFRRALYDRYCNMEEYIKEKFVTFDYPVWLTLSAVSDFCKLNLDTATYTVNASSVSNTVSYEKRLNFQNGIDNIENYIYTHLLNSKIIPDDKSAQSQQYVKDVKQLPDIRSMRNERIVKHMLMELQFGHKEKFYQLSRKITGSKLKWILIKIFPALFMLKKRKYLNNKLM